MHALPSAPPRPPSKLQFVVHEEPNLGVRKDMEDYTICEPDVLEEGSFAFFCVLDGHGGSAVSRFVRERYPKLLRAKLQGFKDAYSVPEIIEMTIDNIEKQLQMIGGRDCGSTFSGLLFHGPSARCWSINIGDSRSVRLRPAPPGQVGSPEIKALSVDHKCSNEDEKKRIEGEGGSIINGRLAGNLMITRSLGDFDFKKYGLSSTPDIFEHQVSPGDVYVIASDGLWDLMTKEKLEKFAPELVSGSSAKAVKAMVEQVIQDGTTDNISVIAVRSQGAAELQRQS